MASGGKKKTTMAKLNRERKLAERRIDKQARKDARKAAAALGPEPVTSVIAGDLGPEPVASVIAGDGPSGDGIDAPE